MGPGVDELVVFPRSNSKEVAPPDPTKSSLMEADNAAASSGGDDAADDERATLGFWRLG